jgi:hypothetical protein
LQFADAGTSGSTTSHGDVVHFRQSSPQAEAHRQVSQTEARSIVETALKYHEQPDVGFGRRYRRLESAQTVAQLLGNSAADRSLRSQLNFALAQNRDLPPEQRLGLYNSSALEAEISGSAKGAANSHIAILELGSAPRGGIEPPAKSLRKAVEFAFKAEAELPNGRLRARQNIELIAARYDSRHPLQNAVLAARSLDRALDSEPAEIIDELLTARAPRLGTARASSVTLSSSPLNASAQSFVPRRMSGSDENSSSPPKSTEFPVLPTDEDFFEALTTARPLS